MVSGDNTFHVVCRYVAKVLEVDEDSGDILVHFDRWSSRYDEYIPIDAGRLRRLTPSRLKELQKEKDPVSQLQLALKNKLTCPPPPPPKMYVVGDRVQAKWEDGKMYFGKVLQVNEGVVACLPS